MKVLLAPGVWLAEGKGDPPRTSVEANAKTFSNTFEAATALCEARKHHRFTSAVIEGDFI